MGRRGKPLKLFPGTGGYLRFTTHDDGSWQQVSAHVMVCEAFHGPRPSPQHHAAHVNGDRTDNRAENLKWATAAENEADKAKHGTRALGERHHQARLSTDQVLEIRRRRAAGETGASLAREFGVTASLICSIHKRQIWRHI